MLLLYQRIDDVFDIFDKGINIRLKFHIDLVGNLFVVARHWET